MAILLAAALVATCREAPSSTPRGFASLAVRSVFRDAQSTAGLTLDRVRLVVVRPPSTVLLDKTYEFPVDAKELRIEEPILLRGSVERLEISLSYLSGETELFSGSTTADVQEGAGPPVEVEVAYVGPGEEVALLSLEPRDTILRFGGSVAFRVSAMDASERDVPEFYVSWRSDDAALVPNGDGVLVAGNARAHLTITAQTPTGISAATTVTIVAPPSQTVKTGGDAQTALVGTRLPTPLEVEVRGTDDLPVPGVEVLFAAVNGGTVDVAQATTDAAGRARTGATLGPVVGRQDFTATVVGVGAVTFIETATAVEPTASFAAAGQVVSEGASGASLVVRLSEATTLPVSIPFTVSGTATSPGDFSIDGSPLVIPAGSTEGSIALAVPDDGVAEGDETIVVTLGTPLHATLGTAIEHTVTIAGQQPSVAFMSSAQTVNEGASAAVTVRLSTPSTRAVTVPFTTTGSASIGIDYTVTTSPLVIAAGSLSGTITVPTTSDGLAEEDETIVIDLAPPTGATLGATTRHAVTISGQLPSAAFDAAEQTVNETDGSISVGVSLSQPSTRVVMIPVVAAGTATAGEDFTIDGASISIPAGETRGSVTVRIVADALAEAAESIVLTLGTPSNAILGALEQHTITIAAQNPTVAFTSASQRVAEGGSATMTLTLSQPSERMVTVPFALSGTASSPADFSASTSPIVFAPGATTATLTLSIVDDGMAESDEDVVVTLGTPVNATLGTLAEHVVTIAGQSPSVGFTTSAQRIDEGGTAATIVVQLWSPSTRDVTVPFTVAGSASSADFTISASPVVIPAGSRSASIVVTAATDGVAESDETVIVTMGTPVNASPGGITVHTVIIAAQLPDVAFASASQAVDEGGVATVTVQLSSPSTLPVTVPFTLSGSAVTPGDFTVSASSFTIPAGATSASISVTVVSDGVAEADETIVLTLGAPTNATLGARAAHTVSVRGQLPVVRFVSAAQTATETAGAATITVELSLPAAFNVTVPFTVSGSASNPSDFSVSASPLVIPAGSTSGTIVVQIVDDGLAEPDETIVATLETPVNATLGAPSQHTVTIPGQVPSVTFALAAQTLAEGTSGSIGVQLSSSSTLPVTVPFTLSGSAANGSDYAIAASPLVIPAGSTSGTISISALSDGIAEPSETAVVTFGTLVNATAGTRTQHTVTIPGQVPTVSFATSAQTVSEAAGTVTISAQLSSPSTQQVSIPFSVSGTATNPADFTISASPLVIAPGSTTAAISVAVVADGTAEPDETVIVTMGTPVNAAAGTVTQHTITIAAQLPVVSFAIASQSVTETTGSTLIPTVTVRLSSASTQPVTIPFTLGGTATVSTDFVAAASPLVIPAGSTTGRIDLGIVGDALPEPDETIVLTIGAPTNATIGSPAQHTLTIVDNDETLRILFAGKGSGSVASQGITPAISCAKGDPAANCTATYDAGTQVTLVATPTPTSEGIFRFEGWTGTGSGFTCTTSTTCTVAMTQSRDVTARFSIPGAITYSPSSATFSMDFGGAPPAPIDVSVINSGERPLQLDPTIPITYAEPGIPAWLAVQIDKLTIDTLAPATLGVRVLSNKLVAGTYHANVIIRDSGLQFSWVFPVTLTVQPPPTAPTISNIVVTSFTVKDTRLCTQPGVPTGTSFAMEFDYSDPNGDGPLDFTQAALQTSYLFVPQGETGSSYTYRNGFTADGRTGHVTIAQCYYFGTNASVTVTMSITDRTGLRSPGASINIPKPAGSN